MRHLGPHPCAQCGLVITTSKGLCTACWRDPAVTQLSPSTPYHDVASIRLCPKCGDRFLRVLEHEIGVICCNGHVTFCTNGHWDREAAKPRPVPPVDGISERHEDLSFRIRSHRRGIGKALTVAPGWRTRSSHPSASVKTG